MPLFDPKLLDLIAELDHLAKSRDDAWQIPRDEGILLSQIALAMNAKTIVEVGTSYGFSGLFWAAALRQTAGKLHTIDKDPRKFNESQANFKRAGVLDFVKNHLGDGATVLREIAGPIDIGFIDADKPACKTYFDLLWPKIRPGGCVITDNATTHKDELADFVRHLRGLTRALSSEISVGNGIEWTIKIVK